MSSAFVEEQRCGSWCWSSWRTHWRCRQARPERRLRARRRNDSARASAAAGRYRLPLRAYHGYPKDDFVGAVTPWYYEIESLGHWRQGSRERAAAGAGHLHVEGLLRGPRPVDGQAVLPLQQPDRARLDLGRLHERTRARSRTATRRQPPGAIAIATTLARRSSARIRSRPHRSTTTRCSPRPKRAAARPYTRRRRCPTGTVATPGI